MAEGRDKLGRFTEGHLFRNGFKSGGRKSAYEEIGKARLLEEAFFSEMDEEGAIDILERVHELQKVARGQTADKNALKGRKKGGMSLFKVALAKALAGNENLMKVFIGKMFPDRLLDETPQGESPAKQLLDALFDKPKTKGGRSKKATPPKDNKK